MIDGVSIERIRTLVYEPTESLDAERSLAYSLGSRDEIAQQDYSLQPRRYTQHQFSDATMSVAEIRAKLKSIDAEYRSTSEQIDEIVPQLTRLRE